ncbi:hypothetical protein L7F22_008945 [Adiantum nelumboides]|nr:hypothetical protein [Adiantum nelumboides]
MPLRPMMGARAFAKWRIVFVGSIAPPAYKTHALYIIVATDYLTKWIEAKATTKNDAKTTAQFLNQNIFTRYGLPIEIVSDRGTHYINEVIEFLLDEFMVIHRKSALYHPQANGQAQSTTNILMTIITKIFSESRADWDQKLHSTLWAYRVAYKTSIGTTPFDMDNQLQTALWASRTAYKMTIGMTPFRMVYGTKAVVPLDFAVPSLRIAEQYDMDFNIDLKKRLEDLQRLDEIRQRALLKQQITQQRRNYWHDSKIEVREFKQGDLVLL